VDVDDGRETKTVYRAIWGLPSWLPQAVNLSEYAGEEVKIRFKTIATYNSATDAYALWGDPTISTGPLSQPEKTSALLDGEPSAHFVGSVENPKQIDDDPEVDAGMKLPGILRGPMKLQNGLTLPAIFAFPWFMDQHAFHQLEYTVRLPQRAKSARPATVAKRVSAPINLPKFAVLGQAKVAHEELGCSAEVDQNEPGLRVKMEGQRMNMGGNTEIIVGFAFAGLHLKGADRLRLNMEVSNAAPLRGAENSNAFLGFILDYLTPSGWSRRVFLEFDQSAFILQPGAVRFERRAPNWNLEMDTISVEEEVNREVLFQSFEGAVGGALTGDLTLDVKKYAPADWTGEFWLGIGVQEVEETSLKVKILDPKLPR